MTAEQARSGLEGPGGLRPPNAAGIATLDGGCTAEVAAVTNMAAAKAESLVQVAPPRLAGRSQGRSGL